MVLTCCFVLTLKFNLQKIILTITFFFSWILQSQIENGDKSKFPHGSQVWLYIFYSLLPVLCTDYDSCCFSHNASFSPWSSRLVVLVWSPYICCTLVPLILMSNWQCNKANIKCNLAASLHIDYPMLFELRNGPSDRVSHCGVLEFIADEGTIYMPYWVGTLEFKVILWNRLVARSMILHEILVLVALVFNELLFYADDAEPAFARGRHCKSEKCFTSKGNIC